MDQPPVPMADLSAQYAALQSEIDAAVAQILATGAFILGPTVADFEASVARYSGVAHGIGVGNGTDALLLGLMALGVGPGDEVITPPFTFVATVETVALLGATPVFADIDPVTFTLDPAQVAARLTARTRAILPVHLFGQLAMMEPLQALAQERGLPILADGAQAIGASRAGRPVGQWAPMTTLSFYPTKNLGAAGDGGMVLTDDDDLADRLRHLRFHGSKGTYDYRYVGVCSRLDALQAAILAVKLPHLEDWNAARRVNAAFYDQALAGIEGVVLPRCAPANVHTYHQYTVRVTGGRRDALKEFLARQKIATGVFYPQPLPLAPAYRFLGGNPGDFPEAERTCAEVLSLPVFPELMPAQRERVAEAIRSFFEDGG